MKTNCGEQLVIGDEVLVDGILRGTIIREDKDPDPMWLPGASPNFYIEDKDGIEHTVKPFFIVHRAKNCPCR
jgi:hypothetical protein